MATGSELVSFESKEGSQSDLAILSSELILFIHLFSDW